MQDGSMGLVTTDAFAKPTTAKPLGAEKPRRLRLDVLTILAIGFFLLAVAFAAAPAFSGGLATAAGLLLLVGLAAVALIALIALRSAAREPARDEPDLESFTACLAEPAAICAADGSVEAANPAWREAMGAARRLPKSAAAGGLYAVLQGARRHGRAEALAKSGGAERWIEAASFGAGRFLLRLKPAPVEKVQAANADRPSADPTRLGAFAVASPFGAALVEGEDAFSGTIVQVNKAWAEIAGDLPGSQATLSDLLTRESREEAAVSIAAGRAGPFEVSLTARPGSYVHLYLSRLDGRAVAYLVDVTEQKQMQIQLAQAGKMQAIGQLAGGVAHDFNNLLSAIQLRLDELLQRHPLGDPSYEGLSEIRQTAIRAADLVRQLLTFSRKATIQRETLDLGELISNFEVLLRRLIREDVRLETDYGRNLPLVRADKAQLENAVMNLVVNARDAVRAHGGGAVRLRTARVSQADALALGYGGRPVGEMALIEVSDDGPGIAPEVLGKIFDPFFTTKPVGEGTGLGLATVYGIVKQSDGWIEPKSEPGHGATFRIFLPVYAPTVLVEPVQPAPPKRRTTARDLSGAGRILFVEDEDFVRGMAAKLLRARGYEVLEAADGEQALAMAEANAGHIDLMISDVIMPGIDGPTLLKKARGFLGSAPVMFISGYAEAEFSDVLEGETGVSFLAKPIDIQSLAERVKQLLQVAA
ncbi:MAG: ATP-binding protein [Caulobacterales bacterium]